ncbi:hypothetical protein PJK45_07130 [Mycobacterium kansasii]|nr:hypothetical protein [Mycobacterium kansasii]KEP43319.1 hypothetical protein MKSMC1_17060 [Mycobacterium kansasii]UCA18495.1 hypothetical protein LA359_20155 [Mycobacterium kansasii]UGT83354.1 hypothetical protein LTS70_12200 [Mycobacterium kansasii]UGT87630.1 hypothetical protein LTT71_05595 [Mycobacterium kansasii]UGU24103.1 hypothetical protein LT351_21890 [Mycobacterium kansasii]
MSAKETSRTVQAVKTVVVVLAAAFAVLAAGCAAEHEPATPITSVVPE